MALDDIERAVRRHLRWVERSLPGRVVAAHPFGSVALRAYRPGRSDIDLLVTLDRRLDPFELGRLRAGQVLGAVPVAASGVLHRRWRFPGTVNAVYVVSTDLLQPVDVIVPVAAHTGTSFTRQAAFDVNPVVWTELADSGVGVVRPRTDEVVSWCRHNLLTFWAPFADALGRERRISRGEAAQQVLNVPRLWVSATTGLVVSREEAGERALRAFADEWHPLIHDALAWRRFDPPVARVAPAQVAAWIEHVIGTTLG